MASGLIRCGHCGQANRVPAAAAGTPRCGKCHQPLPWIADADDTTFGEVAEAAKIPVLVDLWAPWCGPCRMVSPALEQLARDLAGKVKLVKVNVDTSPQISQRFGPRPSRPLGPELNVRAGCGACAGGSMCGRAPAPRSAKPGPRSSRPLLVPSGPGRPSRRRRLTAVPGRRSPRRRPGALSPAVLRLAPPCPPPAGHRDGRQSPLRVRAVPVPPPPPPATSATGMMSMPSFSYAVPNARRTDRFSAAFAKMFSTSISSASSSCLACPGGVADALLHRAPATGHGDASRCPACQGHPASILPRPAAGTSTGHRRWSRHRTTAKAAGTRHGNRLPGASISILSAERRLGAQDGRLAVAVYTRTDRPIQRIGVSPGASAWPHHSFLALHTRAVCKIAGGTISDIRSLDMTTAKPATAGVR